MPRRRIACDRAIAPVVEFLETRTLLTTIVGGGTDPVTGQPLVTTRFYRDAADHLVQIRVGGNTTAEFIGGRAAGLNVILNPLAGTATGAGYDLFNIYVAESDRNSFISVTQIDEDTGDLQPFESDIGTFRINNASTGQSVTVSPSGSTGSILLGARSNAPSPADNIPLISKSSGVAIGVRPATRRVTAGFEVAPGNDFGKFLFGGTVLGAVNVGGSIDSFYAGNVWTGDARGLPTGNTLTARRGKRLANFTVGGNIGSLLVGGSIGTDQLAGLAQPTLNTGFDMRVGGIVGQVAARDAYMGGVDVIHGRASSEFGVNIGEVEGRNVLSGRVGTPDETAGWANGFLEGNDLVYNNSFAQPQILSSFLGRRGRSNVVVAGQLVADPGVQDYVDYYAMPLLAGQDVTLTLRPTGTVTAIQNNFMNVGVFDPDGRLILTDYANVNPADVQGKPIHFTADRPGLYRFAVGVNRNPDFTNSGQNIGVSTYQLTLNGGGDLALGGVMATNQLTDGKLLGYGFFVENGDMGALQAGSNIFSLTTQTVSVRRGNLRSVEGSDLGILDPASGLFGSGPNLVVMRGNVGLLRSTAGVLSINDGIPTIAPLAIGGDFQLISGATNTFVNIAANRSLGVLRAGAMATVAPSAITVNADLLGDDGVVDLIDVAGDLGTLGAGGPAITTGPGGNVRYINVVGSVFRDRLFGGGEQEATVYDPGQRVTLTDDSGTTFDIEPQNVTPNPVFVPGGTNPATIGPTVSVIGYGIRGSGGVAIINLTADGSVRIGAGGRRGSRAHAEIGLLDVSSASATQGNPVITDPVTGQLVFQFPTRGTIGDTNVRNLDVLMDGSGTLDVFKVRGSNLTSIRNETVGEILNVDASSGGTNATTLGTIGNLQATNIGVGVRHTGAAVNPIGTISNAYPFNQQHNGVVSGNVISVEASGAVGNLNVTGSIGTIAANSGGRNTTGTFEGIVGPIVASSNIASVNIGEGILPSGSGNVSRAGVYANGAIGTVRNQGRGSDIRGDIIAGSNIGSVALSNGNIIGSNIEVLTAFDQARHFATSRTFVEFNDTVDNPVFEIGSISLSGYGGIIGSKIGASDIGPISVRRGFGILNSEIAVGGAGTVASINAEGYGIRNSRIDGGANLAAMSASAKPRNVSTVEYSPSARLSERYDIDPFFDAAPNNETDLHMVLGTSARRPQVKRVTDTGVIADTVANGSRNAGSVSAAQIRGSQFHFANLISKIRTTGVIDGLRLTTGRLKSFTSGNSAFALNFSVAGPIDDFRVIGDLDETSSVNAVGPAARITNFIVDGTMNGDVSSSNSFHLLAVGKDLGSPALVKAKTLDEQRIRHGVFGTIQIG